ncbi:unnamed protein product [Fusarium graminearum]|nr:unnamed protein product [Fusarium graminearum]CAG1962073.1 unnamed protein product [Fusarium graminearum]
MWFEITTIRPAQPRKLLAKSDLSVILPSYFHCYNKLLLAMMNSHMLLIDTYILSIIDRFILPGLDFQVICSYMEDILYTHKLWYETKTPNN